MKDRILLGAAAAAMAVAIAGTANAQTKILRISSWAPPTHHINAKVWPTWGECVKKATDGRVTYKIEYKLASPPRQFDLIRKGVADASWIFHGYNAGRYVATQVVEIPLLGTSAEAASVAYWRVHQKYLEKAREHKGVIVVGLTSHGPAVIQTRKPIKRLSDLKGMKIRIPSPIAAAIATHFGAVGVKLPAPKVYEALSSGVADGIFMPVETQKSFRLKEVAPNVIEIPGGLYYGSFAFIMNPKFYLGLPPKDQQAIMGCSGEKLSKLAGVWWDRADKAGRKDAKKTHGKVRWASKAIQREFAPVAKKIEQDWIKQADAKGLEGKKALRELRRIARSYK